MIKLLAPGCVGISWVWLSCAWACRDSLVAGSEIRRTQGRRPMGSKPAAKADDDADEPEPKAAKGCCRQGSGTRGGCR